MFDIKEDMSVKLTEFQSHNNNSKILSDTITIVMNSRDNWRDHNVLYEYPHVLNEKNDE